MHEVNLGGWAKTTEGLYKDGPSNDPRALRSFGTTPTTPPSYLKFCESIENKEHRDRTSTASTAPMTWTYARNRKYTDPKLLNGFWLNEMSEKCEIQNSSKVIWQNSTVHRISVVGDNTVHLDIGDGS